MTRLTGIAVAIAAVVLFAAPALAHHPDHGGRDADHDRHHHEPEHRGMHRYLEHREAHHVTTPWDYERLQDHLEQRAFHDWLQHGEYEPQLDYNPFYSPECYWPDFYYPRAGFSIYFSR